jgi:regulator of protease activity HflC (stomatin/prohibitin superfamily)
MLAEASAEAIRRITAAIGEQTGPMSYLLGEKYIAALERMGEKDNAKVVVLPADLQEAVKGCSAARDKPGRASWHNSFFLNTMTA